MNKTPLYNAHVQLGAKMVNFSNWEMPISYSSLIEEHHAVRNAAGIFDVSHMSIFDFDGGNQIAFFEKIFSNDIKKISKVDKAIYGALLNEEGGILDDLIIYHANDKFRLVSNCSTREQNRQWLEKHAVKFGVKIIERSDMGILAIQGPDAFNKILEIKEIDAQVNTLQPFGCIFEDDKLYARTGYTGEDGLELIVPNQDINHLWVQALELGCSPIGLGARDTLRLEAGLMLSGVDINESTTPLEAQLDRFLHLEKSFVGREALSIQLTEGLSRKLVGFRLLSKGIARHGYSIFSGSTQVGTVTSGGFSISLDTSIGLGYVSVEHSGIGTTLLIDIRGRLVPAEVTETPFYRKT